MLPCQYLALITLLFAAISQTQGQNCIRNFNDAEETILNEPQILSNISNAFFPTTENNAEYLAIRYVYSLDCIDGEESNSSQYQEMDYIWVRSSVYLVVEPNALNDLTLGIVDVNQGSLSINLQCMCPSYPNNVTDVLSRLTAYVSQLSCYAKNYTKVSLDDECKTNSFVEKYNSHDPLYEEVNDVKNSIKFVGWLSLILMLFLEFQVLNTLYTFVHKRHKKLKAQNAKGPKKEKEKMIKENENKQNEVEKGEKPEKNEKDYFYVAWATFYIAFILLVAILVRDIHSDLADSNSTSAHDYKELFIGVYVSWLVCLIVAFCFPKNSDFPVPILTAAFDIINKKDTKLFRVLTFIIQSLMIWIVFCLVQLLTFHVIFILVALLAKPVAVLVTLAYAFSFIAMAISGTSVMLEVISWERINPYRKRSENAEKFRFYNYLKDLPNLISSVVLSAFILALMFVTYQFGEKLGSTLDFTGVPAAIAGTVNSIVIFIVSVALREKTFRDLFQEKDFEEKKNIPRLLSFWPYNPLYSDKDDNDDDKDDDGDDDGINP